MLTLALVVSARVLYPRPQEMESAPERDGEGMPRVFSIYLAAAALIAIGFADFPLIAFHLHQDETISATLVPIYYAVAMGTGGIGSFILGHLLDQGADSRADSADDGSAPPLPPSAPSAAPGRR